MCGFVGTYKVPHTAKTCSDSMIQYLARRGPDHQATFSVNDFRLGVARLAMTDPNSRSNQPMLRDDRLIVFNGEIYNFRDLRKELIETNFFTTESDTEVLLVALSEFSLEVIQKLSGSFAFAFIDFKTSTLVLARDPLGKKPLYYSVGRNAMTFCSLQKPINEGKVVPNSSSALVSYLILGYVVDPLSFYSGVSALSPGEIKAFSFKDGLLKNRNYQKNETSPRQNLGSKISAANVRRLLVNAVESRIQGHNKIALSLSGGFDSTLIAVILRELGCRAETFSVYWGDSDKSRYNNDARIASANSQKLGHNHHQVESLVVDNLDSYLTEYLRIMEEPSSNSTGLSMLDLFKEISNCGIRLALTGDGADEAFMGYERYRKVASFTRFPNLFPNKLHSMLKQHNWLLRKLGALQMRDEIDWISWHEVFNFSELLSFFDVKIEHVSEFSNALGRVSSRIFTDRTSDRVKKFMSMDSQIWLSMESNRRLDRVSMWHSVEARMPFQDTILLDNLRTVSPKLLGNGNKRILLEAFPEMSGFQRQKRKSRLY